MFLRVKYMMRVLISTGVLSLITGNASESNLALSIYSIVCVCAVHRGIRSFLRLRAKVGYC